MKIKRETLSNFAFILLLAVLLFTPVGFHARVLVAKIFSFSPALLEKEEQFVLSDYNWHLSRLDGESVDFENLQGKVVLLNFWATWCPPCIAEMPSLDQLHEDFGDKVVFVLVAHDKTEKVKKFINEKGYSFPVYFEKSAAPDVLATKTIPTTFIINKKGKIVIKKTGAADWNSATTRELLETLVKE